ncbi:MAG: cellulase family glycosylhydrolase [Alphaproteobacteria bacterium]|nr:cellulase family glycosylhydrolase [Alphaproteobacteria bacterium]
MAFLRSLSLAVILTLCAASAFAEQPILHRGINVAGWLANARRQVFYQRDFEQIKKTGFDFVRLPVNPEFFGFTLDGQGMGDFTPVDQALELIISNGLTVVLDIHPGKNFMRQLEVSRAAEERFTELWMMLAERYKNYPQEQLAFQLLNEPQYYHKSGLYNQFTARLVSRIRQIDSQRLLIVETPANASTHPVDLLRMVQIIDDPNIAYDVHYYQPYIFTHQGVKQGFEKKQIRHIGQLPYPSDHVVREDVVVAPDADKEEAQDEIDGYVKESWNRGRIAADFAPAAAWAKQNRVRLLVLEFGVMRNTVDEASRYRWIGDVRSVLDSHNVGWALWDYTDLMGIVRMVGETGTYAGDGSVRFLKPEQGQRIVDAPVKDALGLQ